MASFVHVRIDPELKSTAEAVLRDLQLTPSQFLKMMYRQTILYRRIPEIRTPNASGKIPQDVLDFYSPEELAREHEVGKTVREMAKKTA